MKRDVFVGIVILLLGTVATWFGYTHLVHASQKQKSAVQSVSTEVSANDTSTTGGGLQVGNGQGLGNIIPLSGDGITSGGSQSSTTPNSNNFTDYEKYKDNKEPLYGEIKEGSGKEVGINKKVAIYYKGYLTNGTLFDESKPDHANAPLKPFVFTEGKHEVILGMEQAIFGMKAGGKRRLIIPPAVGYGDHSQGSIPANAVLIFDVELVAVE